MSPWIRNSKFDLFWICGAGLWSTAIGIFLNRYFNLSMGPWAWLILVLGVDVSHVYSTLYRTYFDSSESSYDRRLLLWIPGIVFSMSVLLSAMSLPLFWMVLAYVAVFHFARQQVGFLKIYSRRHEQPRWAEILDIVFVYIVTIGSILIWHLQGPKSFNWFVEKDFFYLLIFKDQVEILEKLVIVFFFMWVGKEIWMFVRHRLLNPAKSLLIFSTAVSWYFGIVYFDSDFVFTFSNVVSHGVPYMALIWTSQQKQKKVFSFLPLFLGILLALAFFEEALWDSLVWRDHDMFFSSFYFLPYLELEFWRALTVSILILPQLTHYVLDGFIWKMKGQNPSWISEAGSFKLNR